MSSQTVSPDSLPNSIPKLDPCSKNWAIFQIQIQNMMEVKEKWVHFNKKFMLPANQALAAEWDKDERVAKYMLTQRLPNSTVIHIQKLTTVAEQWATIMKEYTEKGKSAQMEMCREFMESTCGASGDVRQFLSNLRMHKEELTACRVSIDDDDYHITIIHAIPKDLA